MFFEYHSFSELVYDFSLSWEFISAVGFVLLIGLLLAFIGYLIRGVWGVIVMLAAGAFLYLFRENIPLSWLLG
jgi:F0F1-type ATP synthase assembly protein I